MDLSTDKYTQRFKLIILKKEFIADFESFKDKWKNRITTMTQWGEYEYDEQSNEAIEFRNDLKLIKTKYKLSDNYNYTLQGHMFGFELPALPCICDVDMDKGEIKITITTDTTIDDIRHFWDIIKNTQKNLSTYQKYRYKNMKNLERDILIYQLYELEHKEVEFIIDTVQTKFNCKKRLVYTDIHKIVYEMKEKIKRS